MIDYCTFLTRDLEKEYLPIHFNSLLKYSSIDNLNIRISIPDGRDDFIEYINKFSKFKIEICILPNFYQEKGPLSADAFNYASWDCANRMGWFLDNAKSEWVAISHLDIIYEKSFNSYFNSHAFDSVGMFGVFQTGICVVRKKAYDMTHCGFWQVLDLGVSPSGGSFPYLCSMRDTKFRVPEQKIDFLDVSDMLKIQIRNFGWEFDAAITSEPFYHVGRQSGHTIELHNDNDVVKNDVLELREQTLQKYSNFRE